MSAIIASLLSTLGYFFEAVRGFVIPATVADISLVHVAIWTPPIVGLLTITGRTFIKMRSRPSKPIAKTKRKRRRSARGTAGVVRAHRTSTHNKSSAADQAAARERKAAERAAEAAAARERKATEAAAARQQRQAEAAAARERKAAERAAEKAAARQQRQAEAAAAREQKAAEAAAARQQRQANQAAARERKAAEKAAKTPAARQQRQAAPRKRKRGDPTSRAFGSDPNRLYEFRHRVVDLDSLITSNTDAGGINPAYDPTLQPRQRDRAASRQQVEKVARSLVPESLLLDFHQLDKGAPIVGGDLMVESGNGRALALRRARADFPDQWASYQAKLRENLRAVGLDDSDLDGIQHPVLVRERVSEVDRVEFAREANAAPVLQMSTLEAAIVDASRITDRMVLQLAVREDQSIDQALRAKQNQAFVRSFVDTLGENERAILMRRDGSLNQAGIWRIKAAVFTRVFPGEAGQRLAETFLESLDSTSKNYENAISATLPALAKAESQIASGQRQNDLSLAGDIGMALDMLARLKEAEIEPADYVGQVNMFERELSPLQERLLLHFDDIGRSPKMIRAFLNEYASTIDSLPDPAQESLFEPAPVTKDDLVDRAIRASQPQPKAKAA